MVVVVWGGEHAAALRTAPFPATAWPFLGTPCLAAPLPLATPAGCVPTATSSAHPGCFPPGCRWSWAPSARHTRRRPSGRREGPACRRWQLRRRVAASWRARRRAGASLAARCVTLTHTDGAPLVHWHGCPETPSTPPHCCCALSETPSCKILKESSKTRRLRKFTKEFQIVLLFYSLRGWRLEAGVPAAWPPPMCEQLPPAEWRVPAAAGFSAVPQAAGIAQLGVCHKGQVGASPHLRIGLQHAGRHMV